MKKNLKYICFSIIFILIFVSCKPEVTKEEYNRLIDSVRWEVSLLNREVQLIKNRRPQKDTVMIINHAKNKYEKTKIDHLNTDADLQHYMDSAFRANNSK